MIDWYAHMEDELDVGVAVKQRGPCGIQLYPLEPATPASLSVNMFIVLQQSRPVVSDHSQPFKELIMLSGPTTFTKRGRGRDKRSWTYCKHIHTVAP
jgi:hypothetical protein